MAYCKSCGAYIPDGQTACLACGYDESAEAAYLWNDDPESPDYLVFHTYDSERSIQAKTAYISEHGLGGLIVWQVHGDDTAGGWPMISLMYESLHR